MGIVEKRGLFVTPAGYVVSMNNTTSNPDIAAAEAALVAAGITFTAVATCRDARCRLCRTAPLPAAA